MTRKFLTTREAARYCGYRTLGAIHQAMRRGHLKSAGMRGRTHTFEVRDLDRFMRGHRPGVPTNMESEDESELL